MIDAKLHVVALAVLVLVTGGVHATQNRKPSVWREVSSKDGSFSVLLPHNDQGPEYLGTEMHLGPQATKITGHRVAGYEGDVVYRIDYFDLPPAEYKAYLEDACEQTVTKSEGRLTCKTLSLNGYPGMESKTTSNGEFGFLRYYFVKQRLYVVAVTRLKAGDVPKNLDEFLDSFKLIRNWSQ